MSSNSPPPEAQRYGRSQTPESPRPVHIPEPSSIPVLLNQMDPIFNDTATYNIPHNQSFSPLPEQIHEGSVQKLAVDDHDAVQTFFRKAENQAAAEPTLTSVQSEFPDSNSMNQSSSFLSVHAPKDLEALPEDATIALSGYPNQSHLPQHTQGAGLSRSLSQLDTSDSKAAAESHVPRLEVDGDQSGLQVGQNETTILQANDELSNDREGVDYQSLLDTITQSTSTAPAAEAMTAPTTGADQSQSSPIVLPPVPGLPPKPPPQENPIDFPSYLFPNNNPRDMSESIAPNAKSEPIQAQRPGEGMVTSLITPAVIDASGALKEHISNSNGFAPSLSSQPPTSLAPGQSSSGQDINAADIQRSQDPAERPWSPRTQSGYDQFLEEERRYVTEGIWDKFPAGSRLFVGNLPSEKVTKRDLYHKFHKHGKLAQISIKQAFGFVQFLDASACLNALNAEQGVEIRGRKVHLEISKPQKNTRGAGSKANQSQARRRSRSPDRNNRRNYSDYRDEPGRRQSEYRNRRSPSPRGYRGRDDYRPGSRDGRPRSPIYPPGFVPPQAVYDEEAALPLPRRDPRSVPDVQVLVLEPEVVHSFINWVEQGFRIKGLQASTIWLNPRLPLAAVIKRQIIEGVQAVVKLSRVTQNNSKVPLQVFDRTAGASNVNFNEYVDLDLGVAADIVIQARMRERPSSQPLRSPIYPPPPAYSQPGPYTPQSPSVQYPPSAVPQFLSSSTDYNAYSSHTSPYRPPSQPSPVSGSQQPNLQQLLANLRQPSAQPAGGISNAHSANLTMPSAPLGQVQYPSIPPSTPAYGQYNAAAAGLPGGSHPSSQSQPNVQNIMEQLARYQR